MSLPRAILFDLDDTLISAYSRPEVAWLNVCEEFADRFAPMTPKELATAMVATAQEFWSDPERHRIYRAKLKISRREVVRLTFAELAARNRCPLPTGSEIEALADRFSTYRDEQMRLFPHAHETVDHFRAKGVRLALVTNGAAEDQRAKLIRFDLTHRFHHIQIEGEHGFGKPELRAYLHALSTLGVEAHETWIVGDNLEWEVRAPQALGIYSIWHDVIGDGLPPQSNVRPDRIIRSLSELIAVSRARQR